MPTPKIVLLACGAFNPLTNMHLRMFELARDHLHKSGESTVVCGILSPVHDGYGKNDLESATHRTAMIRLALDTSEWIRLSTWESQQEQWSRTKLILQHHQNQLNALFNDNISSPNKRARTDAVSWIPEELKSNSDGPIKVKLLCGADLLESFGTPNLWADEDIAAIVGQQGLVVITRAGTNPYKFIYESDILTKYQKNITIVTEWITNDVSSTKIRRCIRRGESVKYLLPDAVIDYIKKHSLYGSKETKYLYPPNMPNFLTPSPSDVNMGSPSPTSQFDYTQNVKNLDKTFGNSILDSLLVPPCLNVNDVDGIVTTTQEEKRSTMISFPGQAVQIIKTANGESHVLHHKVGSDEVKPEDEIFGERERLPSVANVQIQITKDGIKVISDKETAV